MKKFFAMLLVIVMVFSLAACKDTAPADDNTKPADDGQQVEETTGSIEGMTVAFIPKLTGNSFFEAANDGAQKYAEQWGIEVKYMGSAAASVTDQLEVIQQAIDAGVDAISISSVDAKALDEKLKEAQDMGIVVTTWDSDVSSDARSLMVSQGTPKILGEMLVDMGADALTNRGVDINGEVKYVWHYSQAAVADQNSWYVAGEEYIKEKYPNWVAVADPFYSEQDSQKSVSIGESIFEAYPDIDLIICNDSTALPGQSQAAQNKGLTKDDVTITGFCTPSGMTAYLEAGIVEQWGLWDCGIQGALGCYFAAYLAAGNEVSAGDVIDVPGIGACSIVTNDELVPGDSTPEKNNGVVLLPERVVFTEENVADYPF
ncbi:MAG: substrate-binding domain-containing protein [Eubacteriales bacterium]